MTKRAACSFEEHQDWRIPVRDGCTLSARIWLPTESASEPMPAILEMLPYRKRDGTAARDVTTHDQFVRHGYVCLRVDLRGSGESAGLFDDEYSKQELDDIEDVIAWIAAADWCNGAVGIMGISWGGFNGLQVAARRPEALKAVITLCSSVDRYADDIHYKGGCQVTENIGWSATAMSWFSMPPDPMLAGETWRDIWLERLENTPFLISRWVRHACRDAYWKQGSVCEDFASIEAAVLAIGGWHDGYRNTPAKLLEGGTTGPIKAIMGPWNHKYPHIARPKPQIDFLTEALRWWDRWLKGEATSVEADPDYRVYVMDGIEPRTSYEERSGRWIGLPTWPSDHVKRQTFRLGDGTLGGHDMSVARTVRTDPLCGRACGEYFPFGFGFGELPDDQQADDALSLCFDTVPFVSDLTVLGAPVAKIDLTSDRAFGQIAVRLCDVAPDGRSTLITFGLLNLQFRDGFETAVPLTPGHGYRLQITLDQAAYRVPAGHRLRLAVSPSYWPFAWPERGDVTLSLRGGALDLPTLSGDGATEAVLPDAPPATRPVLRETRPGWSERQTLLEQGQSKLIIEGDHGEMENTDHGLRNASHMREVWTIDQRDISKARADIIWERSMARGDFSVRTKIETTMHSDADSYYVRARLKAFEQGQCIFDREFFDSIDRDLSRTATIKEQRNKP